MEEIAEIERQGWSALADGTGADFYADVMVDDGVMLLPGVGRVTKAEALAGIEQAPPWSWFELSDVATLPLADDAGVVTYAVTAQRDGQPRYEALMSSTYTRVDGSWRLVLHQQTPQPQPPPS